MLVCCGEIKDLFTVRTITRNANLINIIAKRIEIFNAVKLQRLLTNTTHGQTLS